MKTILLALCLAVSATCGVMAETPAQPDFSVPSSDKDTYPRWSVAGDWNVTHPYWTHILNLRQDGTFAIEGKEDGGRWILSAEGGTPLLVLKWDHWATESLTMVSSHHFRGQVKPGSFIDMRRGE